MGISHTYAPACSHLQSTFFPHLLLPPLLVNTTIGFCLFEAYSITESRLLAKHYPAQDRTSSTDPLLPAASSAPSFTPLWIVALAGGSAGAAQCIVSAPLDNVRIILSSQVSQHKHHSHNPHTRHPLRISWRAVARAAILPFAPEVTRSKLVDQVTASGQVGSAGKETQRLLWEKRVKRWRGGVHGAGLAMSLARDSVGEWCVLFFQPGLLSAYHRCFFPSGFSAFFVVFEISRRLAFNASLSVDRALALFNAAASLPVGRGKQKDAESDEAIHLETASTGDISYSQSRTKTGRFVAACVLVCGGAIGAALYELVGRPAELMRLVIWEGRKAWEEGRRGTKRDAWRKQNGRAQVTGARRREKVLMENAGKELRRGSFLSLRSGNQLGTRLSKVQGSSMQRARRPAHPLKIVVKAPQPSEKTTPAVGADKRTGRRWTGLKVRHRCAQRPVARPQPSLESRPSAYTLLVEHAKRTSHLRYTSARNMRHQLQPTPVPTPVLLFHTYFLAPFNPRPSSATMDSPASTAKASTGKPTKQFRFRNLLHFKYPISSAPGSVKSISQAQVWGSGRLAWTLRRLASPYSIGFLAFAWMSGDLA